MSDIYNQNELVFQKCPNKLKFILGKKFNDVVKVIGYAGKEGASHMFWVCFSSSHFEKRSLYLLQNSQNLIARNYLKQAYLTEYRTWLDIKKRCFCPNTTCYERYGGRGITVDKNWKYSFHTFLKEMGQRPKGKYSIERVDYNGDYTKSNCCWIPLINQAINRSNNRIIEFNGESMCVREWERRMGYPRGVIGKRLWRGWAVSKAILQPPKQYQNTIE